MDNNILKESDSLSKSVDSLRTEMQKQDNRLSKEIQDNKVSTTQIDMNIQRNVDSIVQQLTDLKTEKVALQKEVNELSKNTKNNTRLVEEVNRLYDKIDQITSNQNELNARLKQLIESSKPIDVDSLKKDINNDVNSKISDLESKLQHQKSEIMNDISNNVIANQNVNDATTNKDIAYKQDLKELRQGIMSQMKQESGLIASTINKVKYTYEVGLGNMISFLNTVPTKVHSSTMDFASKVSEKLQEWGDAMDGGENNRDAFVQLTKDHIDFLDKVRSKDMTIYNRLLVLSSNYNNSKSMEEKNQTIKKFLKELMLYQDIDASIDTNINIHYIHQEGELS